MEEITTGRPDFILENEEDTLEDLFAEEAQTDQHQHTVEEQTEQDEPAPKIKVTKWKRKPDHHDDQNADEASKRKGPNVKIPTKKYARLDNKEIQGATHINKAKEEIKIRNSPRLFSEMVYYLSDDQK
ncbi:hypothetical protein POM88_035776 [Heracleum sosnowskyi]|uniref:Uncharacterized protein n=1 Tax=Heracleum sosnowskyi TaxID=360622 RepID=A0AAD8HM38_9APIA|nr:hypothetical protein POM88_035776 [Heracleum sosnowskyi]